MKHYIAFLAALLLLLGGCGRITEEPPAEPPAVESETPPPSGILTDVGRAETLQEYYDRTAIIGRNERMEGNFTQTESWALEYAALEYPGADVQAKYVSGYTLPGAMTRDDLSGGVAVWEVFATRSDGTQLREQVQIFYFTESADGQQVQCFSGLLAGEEMLPTRPEAYAYLALDTRFASRMQTLPDIAAPDNALTVNFSEWEQGAVDQQFYPLSEKLTVVLCRYARGEMSDDKLLVYDLESGQVLLEEQLEGFWECARITRGTVVLENYYAVDDRRLTLTVTLEEDGVALRQESQPYSQYQVGGTVLTWQDGSIYLDEEVLLEGSTEEAPEADAEMVFYNFHQALDDHRFLFSRAGWEWIEYYGVYDLETRTVQPIIGEQWDWDFGVLQVSADGTQALAGHGAYGRWGMTLVDLGTLGQRAIPVGYDSEEAAVEAVTANDDLSRMAVLDLNVENTGMDHIRVYDTQTGAELFAWEVPAELVAGDPEIRLVGQNTLLVNLRQWATDTEWVYRVEY